MKRQRPTELSLGQSARRAREAAERAAVFGDDLKWTQRRDPLDRSKRGEEGICPCQHRERRPAVRTNDVALPSERLRLR